MYLQHFGGQVRSGVIFSTGSEVQGRVNMSMRRITSKSLELAVISRNPNQPSQLSLHIVKSKS